MIDIKDFPEGTRLSFIYSAPITDYYGKKLPYRYVSVNNFEVSFNSVINIPFFHDKIDYSEIEYFEYESPSVERTRFITDNIVFDIPKIKKISFSNFRAYTGVKMFTLNLGDNVEEISGKLTYSSTSNGTFTLNSNSKVIKKITGCEVDYTTEYRINCDCENLTSTPYTATYSNQAQMVYHSGFPNCKFSQTGNYYDKIPNLTYESCISILNNLYDFTGNSVTPSSSQGKLKVHANFLTTVGDEISIATQKGWTITS